RAVAVRPVEMPRRPPRRGRSQTRAPRLRTRLVGCRRQADHSRSLESAFQFAVAIGAEGHGRALRRHLPAGRYYTESSSVDPASDDWLRWSGTIQPPRHGSLTTPGLSSGMGEVPAN